MNLEQSSIKQIHKKVSRKFRSQYERKYYNNNRNSLFELLGSKCVKCGFSDIRALQIDHKIGSCKKDTKIFGSNQLMQFYYLKHPIFALTNLQILCANCNWIKRSENYEVKQKYADRKFRKYESRQRFILGKNDRKVYIWEK